MENCNILSKCYSYVRLLRSDSEAYNLCVLDNDSVPGLYDLPLIGKCSSDVEITKLEWEVFGHTI